ncbi:MAG: Ig-like domain-containing protein [Candidatus Accumulibacter sp.]|uniref:Ig-like domain-containing protein n=1 Tax=Candidatus Accumulibacter proximus TaxID=2954385 RepID=A0A935UGZ1_9PROT|nr:Ig-like domain-containing protein [Candidatus Accumulibacter proximus]
MVIDTAPPLPTITLDADITADDILNAAEIAGNVTVTGTVGGDAKAGDTVTLTVNGQNFTGTVVDTAGVLGFAIAVPGADLSADGDKTIAASITTTDAAGNSGSASDSEGYTVDTAAPSVVVDIVDTSLNSGDKVSTVTFTFSDAPSGFDLTDVTAVGGTLSGLAVSLTEPRVYTATFTANDGFTGIGSVSVADASYTNAAGNSGTGHNDTVVIDTAPPLPTITLDADITADDILNAAEIAGSHRHRHGRWRRQGGRHRHPDGQRPELHRSRGQQRRRARLCHRRPRRRPLGRRRQDHHRLDHHHRRRRQPRDGRRQRRLHRRHRRAERRRRYRRYQSEQRRQGVDRHLHLQRRPERLRPDRRHRRRRDAERPRRQPDRPEGLHRPLSRRPTVSPGIGSVSVADASYTNAAGNIGTGHNDTVAIDTTPPLPTITLDANITADDILNAAEIAGNVTVTGTVGGDAKAGDTVTLTVNGQNFTGTVVDTAGVLTFAIAVPGADLSADADKTIAASITTTDAAGNRATADDSEGYTVDTAAPSVVVDIVDTSLNSGDKVSTVTFTFSDAPERLDLTDVTAVGGTLSGLPSA